MGWIVERIVHFEPGEFVKDGLGHFGFHLRDGRYCAISHEGHRAALVGDDGRLEELSAPFAYPMYADVLRDGSVIVSNFGDARLYRFDGRRRGELLVDGELLGLVDMGNCVVGADGSIWINEVRGGRIHHFQADGSLVHSVGGFGWIYDLRRGPDGRIYVLDSTNFAVRVVDPTTGEVAHVAGTGNSGYDGDGGPATEASFGGDETARFNGPISLAVDERGNLFVGDKFNHVVRMICRDSRVIETIAGRRTADPTRVNDSGERDPLRLNLPQISSMDYAEGRLYVPTDLAGDHGDLCVLRRV